MSSVAHRRLLCTAGMRLITLCTVSLFVSGCISLNSVQSEQEFSAPPDLSRVCSYAWQTGEVLFRAENVTSFSWGSPGAFGYGATLAHVEQLATGCPRPQPERTAKLSVYYLEHESKAYGYAVGLPAAFLTGLTLGTMPVPWVRNYVACVQTTSADGLNRFAIAEGSITSLQNTWGGINMRHHQERRAKLLQDLTSQAWHKLWLLQAENLGAEDCSQKLEAIVGRSESRGQQTDAIAPDIRSNRVGHAHGEPQSNPIHTPSDDFVNCVASGKRQWTYRSKCD